MITRGRRTRLALGASINVVLVVSGCAALPVPPSANLDVKEQKQRKREAVEAFEQKRDVAQFQAALSRWQQGDARGAQEGLKLLLSRNPRHENAGVLLAEILLDEQRPQEARDQIERVLREHPNSAAGHHALAMLLESQRDLQNALKHYREAMKLEPRNQTYKLSYQAAKEGKPAVNKGRRVPAGRRESAERAELASYSPSGTREAELEQLLAASRDNEARLALEQGYKAGAAGDTTAALQLFAKAMQREPASEQIALRTSVLSLRWGQPAAAIELLTLAAPRFPRSAAIHRALGTAYYRAGAYQAAQVALEQALSLDKSSALAYFLMGCTLRQQGQLEAAEQHFSRAAEFDPTLADRP